MKRYQRWFDPFRCIWGWTLSSSIWLHKGLGFKAGTCGRVFYSILIFSIAWPVFLRWTPPAHSTWGLLCLQARSPYIAHETCYQAWWEVSHKWLGTICLERSLWRRRSLKLWFVASVQSCNSSRFSLATGDANFTEYTEPVCFSGFSLVIHVCDILLINANLQEGLVKQRK